MSLYNMMCGFNPACVFLMPMLGRKQEEYPRFRDCFLSDDKKHIEIYTRVGGYNRGCGYGEEKLYEDPNYVGTYDDGFDNTYATYVFNVPEKWKDDFDKLANGNINVSDEYYKCVCEFYPKLAREGYLAKVFERDEKKIRLTFIMENDCNISELGDNPEELIKDAWDAVLKLLSVGSKNHDKGHVEKVEILE